MKRRQFIFKNFATKLRIWKCGIRFQFGEAHMGPEERRFDTYESAVRALQRYSKRYYGEKAI